MTSLWQQAFGSGSRLWSALSDPRVSRLLLGASAVGAAYYCGRRWYREAEASQPSEARQREAILVVEIGAFARTDPASAFGRRVQAIIKKGLDACASDPRWRAFVGSRQVRSPALAENLLQQCEPLGHATEGVTTAQLRSLVWEAAELPAQERANDMEDILARVDTWARAFVHIRETLNPALIAPSIQQAVGLAQEAAEVRLRPLSAQDLWAAWGRAKLVRNSGLAACRWR